MSFKSTAKSGSSRKPENFSDVKFIDVALDAKQEANMKTVKFATTRYPAVLDELIKEGYKVTFKEDQRNNSIMCMVQAAQYDPNSKTIIWVMRSGTAEGALLKMSYYWSISDQTLPEDEEKEKFALSDDDLFE